MSLAPYPAAIHAVDLSLVRLAEWDHWEGEREFGTKAVFYFFLRVLKTNTNTRGELKQL